VPCPQLALSVVLAAHPRRDHRVAPTPGKLTGETRAKAAKEATMDLTDIRLIAVGGTLWLWLLIWLVRTDPCRQTRGGLSCELEPCRRRALMQ
jgi:hypothetical protein